MQAARETRILVNHDDDGAVVVKPIGACTMGICETIQQYLHQRCKHSATQIYFDLSDVRLIDSTFTGMLLSLALKKRDPSGPDVYLVAPSDRTMESLTGMHVHGLFTIQDCVRTAPIDWSELAVQPPSTDSADLVIRCHEQLISADERNEAEFGPVVDAFRRERDSR